jgi:hypothetical protein
MSSTSNPAIVSASANASGVMVISTSSRSQFKEIRIPLSLLLNDKDSSHLFYRSEEAAMAIAGFQA